VLIGLEVTASRFRMKRPGVFGNSDSWSSPDVGGKAPPRPVWILCTRSLDHRPGRATRKAKCLPLVLVCFSLETRFNSPFEPAKEAGPRLNGVKSEAKGCLTRFIALAGILGRREVICLRHIGRRFLDFVRARSSSVNIIIDYEVGRTIILQTLLSRSYLDISSLA